MANHTYQLTIAYNVGGQFAANVLHYNFDDAGFGSTSLAAKGLCDGFNAANLTALKAVLSAHVTLLSFRARAINVVGGFEGQLIIGAGNVGARPGNLSAAGIGPCVIFYPVGNGAQRGRMFLPGVSDTDLVDGIFTAAYKTVVAANMTTIITPFAVVGGGGPTATPVIWSRKLLQPFTIAASQLSIAAAQVRRRQRPV